MNTSRKVLFKLLKAFILDTFTLEEMKVISSKINAGELIGVFTEALESSIETATINKAYEVIAK